MKTYADVADLLNFEGPGLQDYVTADELNELIDGTLAPAVVVDRYLEDLTIGGKLQVATDEATTRADLLLWIRMEIECAIGQRQQIARDDAMLAKLDEIKTLVAAEERAAARTHQDKLTLARQAFDRGATKAAAAEALGISRPTLDAWLKQAE
ncbi:hypothetical protein ACFWPQ_01660 [Streptomyces sp. NPDC058464]|uniref:hypothetical protein n=1 Tax=Streptomyces sp. NPDC058464 TaxID=3346511 RepID=UPI00364E42D7